MRTGQSFKALDSALVTPAGASPNGTQSVYRTFNNRADVNHRYTIDATIQVQMVLLGGIAEGYGNPPVVMCAPL